MNGFTLWTLRCDRGHVVETDFRGAVTALSRPCAKKTCGAVVRVQTSAVTP